MTGEEEAWLRLSLRLRKTPAEVMSQVTWVDFLRYQKIFSDEMNEKEKRDWYDAQLAYEVHIIPNRIWGKQIDSRITLESFLLKFGKPDPAVRKVLDEEVQKEIDQVYIDQQMLYWATAFGMPLPGQDVPPDDTPVKTQMSPDMLARMGKGPGAPTPGPLPPVPGSSATPPSPAPIPPAGFAPRGKRKIGKG